MTDLDELFATFAIEVSLRVASPIERVWDLITDISRIHEFSPEVKDARWLDDGGPVVGARFVGTNRLGDFEWDRVCTIVEAQPPYRFAYVVGDRFDGSPSARWAFELEPDGSGTVVVQRFSHLPEGRSGTRLLADQAPDKAREIIETRREILESGMKTTLEALKEISEKG